MVAQVWRRTKVRKAAASQFPARAGGRYPCRAYDSRAFSPQVEIEQIRLVSDTQKEA
ncbi:hypothetical protein ACPOL_1491 [Acidisarcina polymorpha]|uniref:Uncharacterized protein n=1 Tax=Acidisarcina polymorpha TaxID=2211140 RepID=A0A2Z5FWE3_9BACT|nr:hypothetical protein ACPOL_1491 [Acidisarcina polymorpha]